MVLRVLESWWAPRRVVRGLSGMPDRVMLVVLLLAMLITLIAQAPGHARAAELDPSIPLNARIGGAVMGTMFMMPLLAYGVAALVGALSRLTPWRLTGRASRLALFWALLAAAPAVLLAGLVAGLIGPSPALTLTRAIAGLGFLFIWAAGIAALARRA
ncbi:hypothetical protein D3P06_10290 [Paracoccus aestuarii]|uniref:YIP1 family protein n=2 Tax=Paracoccus aestuarii TaxID=453842 RepID=A0A418ZUH9_9RHOB|nr:hypothetical protein D3P06_10290 [Paracoccus aestuarii]WCR00695.1 hypothetical protein JHW48_07280 [Paracoccus aestuarii]